jgi:hypothetical protein
MVMMMMMIMMMRYYVYVVGEGADVTFASRVLHWTIDVHLYLFEG